MTDVTGHDDFEVSAGPYVLGALSPADRAAFARHLEGCSSCQASVEELAGLPGLLSRVPTEAVVRLGAAERADDDVPPLPPELLTGLLRVVRRRRLRRRWAAGVVAAAAAVAVLLAGIALGRPDPPPPGLAMTSIAPQTLSAQVTLQPVGWGTRLGLVCRYDDLTRGPVPYSLVVVDRAGRSEQVGTWTARPGTTATMDAATSWDRSEIASVEVRTSSGLVVLRLDRPATAAGSLEGAAVSSR